MTETEMGVMCLQAENTEGSWQHQKLGERRVTPVTMVHKTTMPISLRHSFPGWLWGKQVVML